MGTKKKHKHISTPDLYFINFLREAHKGRLTIWTHKKKHKNINRKVLLPGEPNMLLNAFSLVNCPGWLVKLPKP